MKTATSLLFIVALVVATACLASGSLYGLTLNLELVKVDPTTAKVTILSRPPTNLTSTATASAFDPQNFIFYNQAADLRTSESLIVGLSMKDGSLITRAKINHLSIAADAAVIPSSGHIIAVAQNTSSTSQYVTTIDPTTGQYTFLHLISDDGDILITPARGVYDSKRGNFWFQVQKLDKNKATNYLLAYNLQGKRYVVESWQNTTLLIGLSLDEERGVLRAVGRAPGGELFLVSVDVENGKSTRGGSIKGYVLEHFTCALNVEYGIMYAFFQNLSTTALELVGIDVESSEIVSRPVCDQNQYTYPSSLTWVQNEEFISK